jgi:23S rRNA (adenine2503-C2)-methyltransferase
VEATRESERPAVGERPVARGAHVAAGRAARGVGDQRAGHEDATAGGGPAQERPAVGGHAAILFEMDLDLLGSWLAARGQPGYRAGQVWRWLARGAGSYEAMTDLPAGLRAALAQEVPLSTLELEHEAHARDGTVKALFRTRDGRPVEAVLMRYRSAKRPGDAAAGPVGRRSLCLSSQSGCPLTCTFCATGQMRFGRNLTAWEIVDQALHFRRSEGVDHAVFMGMGEPMMNLDAVLGACRRLPDLGITHRRTAISTVGWIPGIDALAASDMPIRLALSLHAADDALRSELMPVNERYPLADVLAACRRFHERKRRMVFVEYVMLAGVNDRYEQALALAGVLDPRVFKVNLIPYNPTGRFEGSSREAIATFRAVLEERGLRATVRLTRGRDIDAACGQLAARVAA